LPGGLPLCCSHTAQPFCRPTVLPPNRSAALPFCHPTALPPYRSAALLLCHPTALPPYRSAALRSITNLFELHSDGSLHIHIHEVYFSFHIQISLTLDNLFSPKNNESFFKIVLYLQINNLHENK
jgi:hypothetical protein